MYGFSYLLIFFGFNNRVTSFSLFTAITKKTSSNRPSSFLYDALKQDVVVIGGGWGGLSAAHHLHKEDPSLSITLIEASPRVGGLVRDGFTSMKGGRKAEAGQHGFWDNYHNIFKLLKELPNIDMDNVLTGYAEQGQYSPRGLEAIWPVYNSKTQLPTGLAQALYTKFTKLSVIDRISAAPLVLAFSEFDNSPEMWGKYDLISFRDLCVKLGVSKRCYEEAFEPMILTGLFAPGEECSAAAALGMAYFFVLKSQNSFDVRWCKGNIGEKIFQPWVDFMKGGNNGVTFLNSTRVIGFDGKSSNSNEISTLICRNVDNCEEIQIETDKVVFSVGGAALNGMVKCSPFLSKHEEFRRFANLRGIDVLATRLYFDRRLDIPYSANACWGFDDKVGQTFFDISKLHGLHNETSVIEVDYYHAASLMVMNDVDIVHKVKRDLDKILGEGCALAKVDDAAIVRLPNAVNWYCPGSYSNLPDLKSNTISNAYFAGDLVKTQHGSWSQEKAFVTGVEVANLILERKKSNDVIPLSPDEQHVAFGRTLFSTSKKIVGVGDPSKAPSLIDFVW